LEGAKRRREVTYLKSSGGMDFPSGYKRPRQGASRPWQSKIGPTEEPGSGARKATAKGTKPNRSQGRGETAACSKSKPLGQTSQGTENGDKKGEARASARDESQEGGTVYKPGRSWPQEKS